MPVQKTDRNTTWTIDASNQTWTLTKDAKITVNNGGHGIYEAGQDGSTIKAFGDISVSGMAYGVYINGSNSELIVGEASHINAKQAVSGIYSGAAGAYIVNRGLVEGDAYGIQGAIWSDVENYGTIRGEIGIGHDGDGSQIYNYGRIDATEYGITSNAAGTHIENLKGAEISGDLQAIFLDGTGTAEIINRGTIRGGSSAAIEGEESELTVVNTGKIVGDVYLGSGKDVFDSRKGMIDGKVNGGNGDDDYYVGASKVRIVEESGFGLDEVFATASHRLAANVELLDLIGKKDINGTGNGGQNWIYDNKGDNALRGGGGSDRLYASGGDDVLTGDGGQDYFVFSPGGVDRITDFEDMVDLVAIEGVQTLADFDALDIKQVKGDVVIDFGGGDKIVIENLLASNFDFNDIAVN